MQNRKPRRRRQRRKQNSSETKDVPASYARAQKFQQPKTQQQGKVTTVYHREPVDTIVATSEFKALLYEVNPGSSAFTWLSTQAESWEYWRFRYMTFEFVPFVGTNVAGQVSMMPEYSAGTPAADDMQSLLSYAQSASGPVYRPLKVSLEQKSSFPAGGYKYVRHTNSPITEPKLYDAASFIVATEHGNDAAAGMLYVNYAVEFKSPQIERPLIPARNIYQVSVPATYTSEANNAWTSVAYDYDNPIINTLRLETKEDPGDPTSTLIALPPGTYNINVTTHMYCDRESDAAGVETAATRVVDDAGQEVQNLTRHVWTQYLPQNFDQIRKWVNTIKAIYFVANLIWVKPQWLVHTLGTIADGNVSVLTSSNLEIEQLSGPPSAEPLEVD
jgi:hypothetical protein